MANTIQEQEINAYAAAQKARVASAPRTIDKDKDVNVHVSRSRPEEMVALDKITALVKLSVSKILRLRGELIENPPQEDMRKAKLRSPNDPTPERVAKEPRGFDGDTDGLAKTIVKPATVYEPAQAIHRVKSPLEIYGDRITINEKSAAQAFISDWEAAHTYRISMSDYESSVRSTPGPRAGGMPEHLRARHDRFVSVLEGLDENSRHVLAWLVGRVDDQRMGRPPTVQEVGAFFTRLKNLDAQRAAGLMALKVVLWQVHKIYRDERAQSLSRVRPQLKGPRKS